ncbi:hypothetical protein ACE7GA_08190 [Roseomonas sp. CCTCC AB2023176]|uniref:hypothetical protein n=1 Tax=Roseomonas sp. CCTCC AB2023176 TaxID=3342640 RepID=UPI0035E1A8B4
MQSMLADIPLDRTQALEAGRTAAGEAVDRLPLPVAAWTIIGLSGLLWYGVFALVTAL